MDSSSSRPDLQKDIDDNSGMKRRKRVMFDLVFIVLVHMHVFVFEPSVLAVEERRRRRVAEAKALEAASTAREIQHLSDITIDKVQWTVSI